MSPVDIPSTEGLKASLKDDLTSIIGDPRAVVLYETLSNGTYKVIGFVGLRILDVKITGNNKTVRRSRQRWLTRPSSLPWINR